MRRVACSRSSLLTKSRGRDFSGGYTPDQIIGLPDSPNLLGHREVSVADQLLHILEVSPREDEIRAEALLPFLQREVWDRVLNCRQREIPTPGRFDAGCPVGAKKEEMAWGQHCGADCRRCGQRHVSAKSWPLVPDGELTSFVRAGRSVRKVCTILKTRPFCNRTVNPPLDHSPHG